MVLDFKNDDLKKMICPGSGKRFFLTDEQAQALRLCHRGLQVALCRCANNFLGTPIKEPFGVFQYQGGIVVGDHEIFVGRDVIRDINVENRLLNKKGAWTNERRVNFAKPRPREIATAAALEEVLKAFNEYGAYGLSLYYEPDDLKRISYFDPLNSLLNLGYYRTVVPRLSI